MAAELSRAACFRARPKQKAQALAINSPLVATHRGTLALANGTPSVNRSGLGGALAQGLQGDDGSLCIGTLFGCAKVVLERH